MANVPCLDHVLGIINSLTLNCISTRFRRRMRIWRDSSSTCVDSAIEVMEKDMLVNPFHDWSLVQCHFEHTIREFLIRVRDSKGSDKAVRKHLMGLVRSIEDEFENAGLLIEHAIAEGDDENLESVQSELLQKAEIFVTRIEKIPDLNPNFASTSSDDKSMAKVSCLEHFSDPVNWLPFGLNIRMRRHNRIQKDPNSTSLDSVIQVIEKDLRNDIGWFSLKLELDGIKKFINFAKNWSGADNAAGQHLEEVVRSIDYEFETADLDIVYALRTGDDQRLDAVLSNLKKKITLFRARTKEASDFCEPSRRYRRIELDGYSTHLDSTLDILRSKYGLAYRQVEWGPVGKGLEMIQMFLVFVPRWSANDIRGVGKHLGDVVSCIEGEFKTTEVEIEKAINSGDGERLDCVREKLVDKIEGLKPRIKKAYEFLSDYAFETTIPGIADSEVWLRFCRLLRFSDIRRVLNTEFSHILDALKSLGTLYITDTFDRKSSRDIGFLIQGVSICLARFMFLWWTGEMNQEDGIIMVSDLLQRIRPTSPEILCMYMDDLINLGVSSDRNMHHLLDLILPPSKASVLKTIQDVLDSLLKYWVDSYSTHPEDLKLLRLDIEKVICDAASVSYSCIMAAGDDDDMLFQLLQRTLLLNLELVLVQLAGGFDRSNITFESIYKGLNSAQTILHSPQDVYSERLVLIFTRIEQVARQAQSLPLQEDCDVLKFQKLFLDFKLTKIQAFLIEQMRCCPSLVHLVEDRVHTIDDGIQILSNYLSPLLKEQILICTEIVSEEETPPYYSFRSNQDAQQFSNEMSVFVINFLEKVNVLNSQILDKDLLRSPSSLVFTSPRMTHQGVGFLDILFQKLEGLVANNVGSIGYTMKHQIEAVIQELGPLRSFWVELAEKKNAELADLRARVAQAAYGADYLIDWILLVNRDWSHMSRLSNVIDEMKTLNFELTKFDQMKNGSPNSELTNFDPMKNDSQVQASEHMIITRTTSSDVGEAGISLKDQEDIVINQLTSGTSMKLEVVTIVGMPGIGKTTLARKVYNHPRVKQHFYKIAWCSVSQVYRKRELLFEILGHVTESSTGDMSTKTDEELLDMMYQGLKGQRYLVVMDDVWGTQAWDELKSAFSDDENGSKILFTTRNMEVGLKAPHSSDPHPLRFFDDEESWMLLKEKVFHKDECPKDLLNIGKEIAKGCKGLPMSIIAIAGILKTLEKDVEFWKKIEKDLHSRNKNPDIQCMHILELSYDHLPDDLKPCFLYFAAFGEDTEVTVQKLIRIWIAEGFVREIHLKSPEVVAESYVMTLIGRSLLMAPKKRSGGRVKTCKVHDMVYNLCSRKIEEENFLQYINGYDNLFPSSQLDYGIDSQHRPITKTYCLQRRLSICSKRKHFVMLKPSGPSVRTLLFSATSDTYPRCPYEDVSFITEEFKILSVLDIENINFGSSFPKGIEMLYVLRYLAISGNISSVPSTIAKLWNLETFIVKGLMGKVALPDTLWSMSRLRHLHVSSEATFSLEGGSLEGSAKLNKIASLSCPALSDGKNSVEMMKLFPNVQKLKCTFSESKQNSEKGIHFPILDFLASLQWLKVIYYGSRDIYCQLKGVTFPLNLKRLSLSNFRFTWEDFSAIGELPDLKILSLKSIDFNSPEWKMSDEEFKKLEYLKLDSLKIVKWNVDSDSLPNLQQLVLRSCDQLEEVPSSFGEIPTLQMIEMKWCSASAGNSVVQIQKKKLEYGYNDFEAFVNGMVPKS